MPLRLLNSLSVCLWMTFAAYAGSADGDLGRRYLAVDSTLHARLVSMDLVMGQAANQRLILTADAEWEVQHGLQLGYIGSIVRDPSGHYRLYYEVRLPAEGEPRNATALATSPDGVNWTKPPINRAPHLLDHPQSNLIFVKPVNDRMVDGPGMADGKWYRTGHVFYDERAPEAQRYKLAWREGSHIYVATSANGLDFVTIGRAVNHKADTNHSYFYDPFKQQYVMYGRKRTDWTSGPAANDRRGIALHSSPRWEANWPNVGKVVVDPIGLFEYTDGSDGTTPTGPDVYTPNVQIYHGQYIGLPSVFFRNGQRVPFSRPERTTGTGPLYPLVMHSLDGEHWVFADKKRPIIDLTPHQRVSRWEHATSNALEVGQIHPAANFIERDDRLLIYYLNRDDTHYEDHPGVKPSSYHVAFLRVDGFASLRSRAGKTGEWRIPVLPVPKGAKALQINAKVGGTLRVEVLDAVTRSPIAGLALDDSVAFSGDGTQAVMRWRAGSFADAAGRSAQLRFVVTDGEVFSFSFRSAPEPASSDGLDNGEE